MTVVMLSKSKESHDFSHGSMSTESQPQLRSDSLSRRYPLAYGDDLQDRQCALSRPLACQNP